MKRTLSVIVVDFKSLTKTLTYIKHLQDNLIAYEAVHFIVVDNDPQATIMQYELIFGSVARMQIISDFECYSYKLQEFDLVVVMTKKNNGYARGNNIGVHISETLYNDSIFLVSNNDLLAKTKINISLITEVFESNEFISLIGPKIISVNGVDQSPRKNQSFFNQCILYYWNSILGHRFDNVTSNIEYGADEKEADWLMGAFVFIKREAFDIVGGYDESTFLFGEEMILSAKMKEFGYINYYLPRICVLHNHGATVKTVLDIEQSNKIALESVLYYFRKYRAASNIQCKLAWANFKIYAWIIKLKQKWRRESQNDSDQR